MQLLTLWEQQGQARLTAMDAFADMEGWEADFACSQGGRDQRVRVGEGLGRGGHAGDGRAVAASVESEVQERSCQAREKFQSQHTQAAGILPGAKKEAEAAARAPRRKKEKKKLQKARRRTASRPVVGPGQEPNGFVRAACGTASLDCHGTGLSGAGSQSSRWDEAHVRGHKLMCYAVDPRNPHEDVGAWRGLYDLGADPTQTMPRQEGLDHFSNCGANGPACSRSRT